MILKYLFLYICSKFSDIFEMAKTILIAAAVQMAVLLAGPPASAQRTAAGSSFASLQYDVPAGGRGISAGCGRYSLDFLWRAELSVTDRIHEGGAVVTDDSGSPVCLDGTQARFDRMHIAAGADVMYRIAASYSRGLNAYAGGGVFLGMADYALATPDAKGEGTCGLGPEFIYGMKLSSELEVFLARRTAIILCAQARISPPTAYDSATGSSAFLPMLGAGVRVNMR